MEYKGFAIWPFQREPGRWRCKIGLIAQKKGSRKEPIETTIDATTAAEAVAIATVMIDNKSERLKKNLE